MNPIADIPHGEMGIITMTLARLIWRTDRFTGVALAIFAAVHLAVAVSYVLRGR